MAKGLPGTSALAGRAASLLRVRWLVRAPVWAYRARLGFLFGSRLLMLEHTGRNTQARRYVVLEVVGRLGSSGYVVASGFGERAQWFRNIRADPRVRIYLRGHRPVQAIARVLDHDEAAGVLGGYASAHPRAWAAFTQVLENTLGTPIGNDAATLPLVALDTAATAVIRPGAAAG